MASLREQLLQRVATLLAPGASGSASTSRSRENSITRSIVPAIVIMPGANTLQRMGDHQDKNSFDFSVEIFTRGDPWDSLADPIDVKAHSLLMADFADKSTAGALGTFMSDLRRIDEAFDGQEADRTAGTLTVRYRATFLTSWLDISKPA